MRVAAGMLVAVSACYSPTVPAGAPCDIALNNCPAGQRCEMTPSGAFCGAVPVTLDSAMQNGDGPRPDTAPGCYGTGIVSNVCLMPAPTMAVDITADRTINTAMVGNNNCDQLVPQSAGPSLCLIAGTSITIAAGVKLIGIGPNPLLLIATDTFTVTGTIDVSTRITSMALGAGAQTSCGTSGVGQNGGGTDGAGGGGAGGSFGTVGGTGGNGRNGGSGGNPIAPVTINNVLGGCPGFRGGHGSGGSGGFGGPGAGGGGGGAVYLIAGTSLSIGGVINASGGAGGGGLDSQNAGAGGGGGGTGGMIVLDAPSITLTGSVYANGAGGGGGNGAQPANSGSNGLEPASATTQASGGAGGAGGGGTGGKGYALSMPASNGANGSSQYCAGGGGGGGAGIVRVFGVAPGSLGGAVSPPAT